MEMSAYDFPRSFKLPHCSLTWGDVLDLREKYWTKTLPDKVNKTIVKLTSLGWFISEDIPLKVLEELAAFPDNEIETATATFFQNQLATIQNDLGTAFPKRKLLFDSAFQAHQHNNYNASIPLLLAQADGICQEWLGAKMFSKPRGVPCTKIHIEDKDILTGSLLEALVQPLKTGSPLMLGKNEMKDRRTDNSGYSILNRHEIMHGIDLDYGNERNSLKGISLLTYLAFLNGCL